MSGFKYKFSDYNYLTNKPEIVNENISNKGTISGENILNIDQHSIYTCTITVTGCSFSFITDKDINYFTIIITNGGSGTIVWNNSKWTTGVPPTLTTAGVDIISGFTVDNGNNWYLNLSSKDIK